MIEPRIEHKVITDIGEIKDVQNDFTVTDEVVRMRLVLNDGRIWKVTAGPNDGNSGSQATFRVIDQPPGIQIITGWIIVMGDRPVVNTDRISAGADSTTLMMQVTGAEHRAFVLSKASTHKATVTDKPVSGTPTQVTKLAARTYAVYDLASKVLSPKKTILSAPTAIKDAVDYAETIAEVTDGP